MTDQSSSAWKCSVCGYVHRQPNPPEVCPVCGAPQEAFEPFADAAAPTARTDALRWQCLNCGYVHTGPAPPDECPVCAAPSDRFEPVAEAETEGASAAAARKVVIVGAGIAGIAAAEAVRSASPEAHVTLVSKESDLPYYRLNLTRYLAGELDDADLPIHPESWYDEQGVQLLRAAEVSAIDLGGQLVQLRGAGEEPFEKLILTIGAHPFMPPFPGVQREGVSSLRTIEDAKSVLQAAKTGARCLVIGGGLLGLEAAGALANRGADVTLLESHAWLMPRQLNQSAGEILERHVTGLGIKLLKQARTAEVLGDERIRSVLLEDGTEVPADLAVVATGIRSNSYLARLAGLEVNQGVVVNNTLTTSHPNVLAAGDVAEHRGVVYGIWPASQSQGGIAGMNAAGVAAEFGGIPRSNTLKVLGLDLFSIGTVEPQDGSFSAVDQETDGGYFRFVFRDTHLVGAVLLGDTSQTAAVKKAVQDKTDFSDLLWKRPSAGDVLAALGEGGSQ